MRRRIKYIIVAVLMVSCNRINPESDDFKGELISRIETKEGIAGTENVYRVYLNGLENYDTYGVEATGTYYDSPDGGALVPCSINKDLTFNAKDDSQGLRAKDGWYKMHIVYPPVEMTDIPDETDKRGYEIKRELNENDTEIYLSKAEVVKLDGVYLYDTQSRYVFDASAMPLKQPRSRIIVNFQCSENVSEITLRKVSFKNIISKGFFRPVEGIYYFKNDGSAEDDVIDEDLFAPENGEMITKDNPKELAATYILSMDYSENDAQGNPRWPLPSLVFEIGDSVNPVTLTVPLAWNFEQQKEYVFNIRMNHIYISGVTVTVSDWTSVNSGGTVTDPETWSLTIGEGGIVNWTQVNGITGTIE